MVDNQAKAIELKPCPFCGSDMSSFAGMTPGAFCRSEKEFAVGCDCRGCSATGPLKPSMEEAVEAWNTRAVSISRASQGSGVGAEDDVYRAARAVRKNQFARIGRLSSYDPEIAPTENELDDARAAISALSPPATPQATGPTDEFHLSCPSCGIAIDLKPETRSTTPQAPEDVREAVNAILLNETGSGLVASRATVSLAAAGHLATPVTVTMEECAEIGTVYGSPLLSGKMVAEALRRVLGDRIQISGSEGLK